MTVTANTRTLPEALPDSAAKIRVAWPAGRSLHDRETDETT